MDLARVLRQLHEELQNLDAAILSLERLEASGRRNRGSTPAMLAELKASAAEAKKKRDPREKEASRK